MPNKLRKRAEMQLKKSETTSEIAVAPEEMRQTLHELRVHQIELEMQNEELRRTQVELEGLRAKYFDLYDLAPIGYVTLSEKGMLLEANVTFASMLGVPRGVFKDQAFSRFISKEDQDTYYLLLKQLVATGQPQGCELRLMKSDSAPFWARINAAPAKIDGNGTVYRVVVSDISDRKHAEELQDQIDGIIQHDLRSPAYNAVNVATLLLESDGLDDEQRQLLVLLNNAGRQMLDTLDRSLDLYKIETGQYREEPKVFDCLPVAHEIAQNLHNTPQYRLRPVRILLDGAQPSTDACFPCAGQMELLRASLLNLMKNALEASPKGEDVVVNMITGRDCHIEIRNRGVVPTSVRDRFFEKYSTAGKNFGTGLGTYSAKMMINAQGGTLEMRTSDTANETVLTIHLPASSGLGDQDSGTGREHV